MITLRASVHPCERDQSALPRAAIRKPVLRRHGYGIVGAAAGLSLANSPMPPGFTGRRASTGGHREGLPGKLIRQDLAENQTCGHTVGPGELYGLGGGR